MSQLKYALVTVTGNEFRQSVQMGLCVPSICTVDSLGVFDKLYSRGIAYTKIIKTPNRPTYTFPKEM